MFQAQDKEYPWYVEVGYNVVDFYPNGEGARSVYGVKPFGDFIFEGYLNANHYNISPKAVRLAVGRYVGENFILEFSGSFNEITSWGDIPVDSLMTYPAYSLLYKGKDKLEYYGFALSLNYSFRNAIDPEGWADPFIGLGGGITMVEVWDWNLKTTYPTDRINDFIGTPNINIRAGLGIWLSSRFSIVFQSAFNYVYYEHDFKNFTDTHFQHSLGIRYHFGFNLNLRNGSCYF